jgi:hypothetical protein
MLPIGPWKTKNGGQLTPACAGVFLLCVRNRVFAYGPERCKVAQITIASVQPRMAQTMSP